MEDVARMSSPGQSFIAVIKVVGVGGGGVNAVNRMIDVGLQGVEFIAVNTDAQALLMSDADIKLDIGRALTRVDTVQSFGRSEDVAEEADTRSLAAHKMRGPKSIGALTIGVVTRPFAFEGRRRSNQAEQGIQRLREKVDTLIVIPNERLLAIADERTSMVDAFKMADEVLLQGVSGITDLINVPGLINTDFADVKMVMNNAGSAIMGIGTGSGEGRAVNAARHAITSPLLEASIEGARGILLNIAGGSDLTLWEVNEAAAIIHDVAHPDANIIFGNVIDESLGDLVRVTVIAAGFDRFEEAQPPVRQGQRSQRPSAAPPAAPGQRPAAAGAPGSHLASPPPGPRSDPELPTTSRGEAGRALPDVFGRGEASRSDRDVFGPGDDDLDDFDDDFDVPSFLK